MPETLVAPHRTFAALADSAPFRRYYAGQGISLVGTFLQASAVNWLVFELTGSEWMLGVLDAAGTMPGLLVGLLAGAIADRVAPRRMILAMLACQIALAATLAGLVGLGAIRIWHLGLILAASRVCVTFEMPSRQVFLYEVVGRSSLLNAIALLSGLFNAARVVGPALAGLILAGLGPSMPFALNSLSFLAAIAAILSIDAGRRRPAHDVRPGILGGLAYLGRDRRVAGLFGVLVFIGVVGMGYMALVPAYAHKVVRTGPLGYSILLSCSGVGATVGALAVARLSSIDRKERIIVAGLAIFSIGLGLAGLIPPLLAPAAALWVAGACLMTVGLGAVAVFATAQTLIQSSVPDELRGRVAGLWMIAYSGSVPLGSLWAGWAAERAGVGPVMAGSAAVCLAMSAAIGVSGRLGSPGLDGSTEIDGHSPA